MTKGMDRGRHDVFARVFRVCACWPVCVCVSECGQDAPKLFDGKPLRARRARTPWRDRGRAHLVLGVAGQSDGEVVRAWVSQARPWAGAVRARRVRRGGAGACKTRPG